MITQTYRIVSTGETVTLQSLTRIDLENARVQAEALFQSKLEEV